MTYKIRFNLLDDTVETAFRSNKHVEYCVYDLDVPTQLFERVETILHNDFYRLEDIVTDVEIEASDDHSVRYGRFAVFRETYTRQYRVGFSLYNNIEGIITL